MKRKHPTRTPKVRIKQKKFVYGVALVLNDHRVLELVDSVTKTAAVNMVYNLLQGLLMPLPKGQIRKLMPAAPNNGVYFGKQWKLLVVAFEKGT